MGKLEVQLKRSCIGHPEDQRRTVQALGLRRLGQTVVCEDTPSLRGMLFKVKHLIQVRERTEK